MKKAEAEKLFFNIQSNLNHDCAYTLKNHFGEPYNENASPREVIAAIKATGLAADSYDMPSAYITATMYYTLGGLQGEQTLPEYIAKVYQNPNTSDSLRKTIEELLTIGDINSTRFVNVLKRIVSTSDLKRKPLNYVAFLYDLANWDTYDIYKQWANKILVDNKKESEDE